MTWLPFELHPDTPHETIGIAAYFGHLSPDQVEQMLQGPKARANAMGLPFNPPPFLANSRRALQLAEYARDQGKLDALHVPLFQAYFVKGQNLSDEAVLREAAATAGLDPDAAMAVINEGRYDERLDQYTAQARQYGITGVPAFIINDKYKIVGAHPYERLVEVLRKIGQEG